MDAQQAAGFPAARRVVVIRKIAAAISIAAVSVALSACATSPAASQSRPASSAATAAPAAAAAPAGECKVDAMKICTDAQAAGTLESPPTMGGGSTQAMLPRTARLQIPGGPAIQAMCYYNPQRRSVTRAEWTATATLDANAIAYLKSKKLCAK